MQAVAVNASSTSAPGLVFIVSRFCWSFERWALAAWTGLTLGHYFLDGVIWKFKRYKLTEQLVEA